MIRSHRKGTDPIAKIQLFGQRCSGTNYLEALLRENIHPDILTWDFGWKHWFCTDDRVGQPDHLFVVLYRHPVHWLQSLHRRPWHAGPELRDISFSEFIRHEWYSVFDEDSSVTPDDPRWYTDIPGDLDPKTGRRFRHVIAMRNAKVQHFESFRDRFDNTCYLRYEDLRSDPEVTLRILAAQFSLPLKPEFQPVSAYKGSGDSYSPQHYDEIERRDRLFILSRLKLLQEQAIGYPLDSMFEKKA